MCSDFSAPTKQALGFSLDIPANRVSSYRARRSGSGCQEESPTEGWEDGGLRGLPGVPLGQAEMWAVCMGSRGSLSNH